MILQSYETLLNEKTGLKCVQRARWLSVMLFDAAGMAHEK